MCQIDNFGRRFESKGLFLFHERHGTFVLSTKMQKGAFKILNYEMFFVFVRTDKVGLVTKKQAPFRFQSKKWDHELKFIPP